VRCLLGSQQQRLAGSAWEVSEPLVIDYVCPKCGECHHDVADGGFATCPCCQAVVCDGCAVEVMVSLGRRSEA